VIPIAAGTRTQASSRLMRSYHFQSSAGTFWIRPHFGRTGEVQLGVDRTPIATFPTAATAALDFWARRTGWYEWDCRSELPAPRDLSEWAQGIPRELASTPYLGHSIIR
jgi:hypothetical protein